MTGHSKEELSRFRQAVRLLVSQNLSEGLSMDVTLARLSDEWNPLFDSKARHNLVEDVNALVRDFMRPIRASLQAKPPDGQRVNDLAEQLSTSKSLARISKKEPLRRYLQLYILKCLGEV